MFNLFTTPAFQSFAATCGKPTLIGLVPWYQYLTVQSAKVGSSSFCNVVFPKNSTGILGTQSPFLLIGLAIIDDLLRVAALVAVGYVIYGGISYTTSGGSPDAVKRAQQSIINALIGLVLAILAAAIVTFIGNSFGG
jgi:hypothetical protein